MMIPTESAGQTPDESSELWLARLRADGAEREAALGELHELLLAGRAVRDRPPPRFAVASPPRRPRGARLPDRRRRPAGDPREARRLPRREPLHHLGLQVRAARGGREGAPPRLAGEGGPARGRGLGAFAAAPPRPSEAPRTRELLAAIGEAIERALGPRQREVLVAIALNDVPIDVLAERLGTTRGAIYKTLHDARRKLRAALAERGFESNLRPKGGAMSRTPAGRRRTAGRGCSARRTRARLRGVFRRARPLCGAGAGPAGSRRPGARDARPPRRLPGLRRGVPQPARPPRRRRGPGAEVSIGAGGSQTTRWPIRPTNSRPARGTGRAVPRRSRAFDREAAERAAAEMLTALGADLDREGLAETPRRMVDAYVELLTPRPFRATTFANEDGYDELVLVRDDPLPLALHAPRPALLRRRPRRLPARRADRRDLQARPGGRDVRPRPAGPGAPDDPGRRLARGGAAAERRRRRDRGRAPLHVPRGVQKFGATTVTSALRGALREDPRTRQEFLALAGGGKGRD